MGTVAQRLGARIRRRRDELGLTLEQVCDRAGGALSTASLASYEHGTVPSLLRYFRLCQALDVGPLDLLPDDLKDVFPKKARPRKVTP